jgi:hypothetical protein
MHTQNFSSRGTWTSIQLDASACLIHGTTLGSLSMMDMVVVKGPEAGKWI